ncbi:Peptidase family M28 [Fodinibius roseus]|uniref:Peptidase family M28 n=1 Tax=Fodinibius roseus TaxID=1194090 RepID=A0A1M5F5T1_9BACT|nr:M28 family metallopeptidase [Fodinibius roseus]SHF86825.1 Peptidase family M28 [Fodinibius roseus]
MSMSAGCGDEVDQEKKNSTDPKINRVFNEISVDSIESNIRTLANFHTRHTTSDTTSDSTGIGAARRWIYDKFQQYSQASGNRLRVSYESHLETDHARLDKPTRIVNIIGVLPGTQLESKERKYVVSGHYDSRVSDVMDDTSYAPGANDDASGTAAVMELARVMSTLEFDATIIFMAVAGEEQGLLGSSHYAEQAKSRELNIAAMFTNDIIGNTIKSADGSVHDDEVRVFAQGIPPEDSLSDEHRMLLATGGENDTPARQLGRFIHRVGEEYMPDLNVNVIYRKDRYLRGGDHSPFLDRGYPAVRFSEPHEFYERQHQDVRVVNGVQYGDLPEFVDYAYVGKITKLNAAVLATLANAPARPREVGIDVSKLENNTTLLWTPNEEPDLKGYEIVWRPTNQTFWEHSRFAGDTTRFTIEGVSKDNYLFGVRAVDQYDNRSPAVYPQPVRN